MMLNKETIAAYKKAVKLYAAALDTLYIDNTITLAANLIRPGMLEGVESELRAAEKTIRLPKKGRK